MTLAAGTRLGPYEVTAPLGAGGMGEVVRARDTRLDRDVAIKVLPESFTSDPDRRARFEREARAVAALSHPNILAVYDTGVDDDRLFVVTELLEGDTLRERLAAALPVRKAIDIASQMSRGLSAAHAKGIVHRDLKPENVFLTREGQVKILDFGLARQVSPDTGATETVAVMTDPGTVLGTVGYMAPSGIVTVPAAGGDAVPLVVPEYLNHSPVWAPGGRTLYFVSNRQGVMDIYAVRVSADGRAEAEPRRITTGLGAWWIDLTADGRHLAYSTFVMRGNIWSMPIPSRETDTSDVTPLTRGNQLVESMRVSLDGRWLVYDSTIRRSSDIFRIPLTGGEPAELTSEPADEFAADLSPDGREVAYHAYVSGSREIFVKPVDGGPAQQITAVSSARQASRTSATRSAGRRLRRARSPRPHCCRRWRSDALRCPLSTSHGRHRDPRWRRSRRTGAS